MILVHSVTFAKNRTFPGQKVKSAITMQYDRDRADYRVTYEPRLRQVLVECLRGAHAGRMIAIPDMHCEQMEFDADALKAALTPATAKDALTKARARTEAA